MIDLIGFYGIERALTMEAFKLFEQMKVACCGSLFVA
jgi:hypothetical protein